MTNKYLPKLVKLDSYARILLDFLKQNPELKVMTVDFIMKKNNYPFLGLYPGARLSELKEMGLVEIVEKVRGKKTKTAYMNIYKITEKGLNFKL